MLCDPSTAALGRAGFVLGQYRRCAQRAWGRLMKTGAKPAWKVWNHFAWQDLGEFGATLACDAWRGCSS